MTNVQVAALTFGCDNSAWKSDGGGGFPPPGDGKLYGVAIGANGVSDFVFKINPDGTGFTVLHVFGSGNDGWGPRSPLTFVRGISGSNTNVVYDVLYGTTERGGDNDEGIIFGLPVNIYTNAIPMNWPFSLDGGLLPSCLTVPWAIEKTFTNNVQVPIFDPSIPSLTNGPNPAQIQTACVGSPVTLGGGGLSAAWASSFQWLSNSYSIPGATNLTYTIPSVTTNDAGIYTLEVGNVFDAFTPVTTILTVSTPPPSPTGFTATPGDTQVALSWTASSGATSYNVYRSTGGTYTKLNGSPITATTYTDTTAANGTTYYYVVTAVNSCGESAYSSAVGPIIPGIMNLTYNSTTHLLSWSWNGPPPAMWVLESTPTVNPYIWDWVSVFGGGMNSIATEGMNGVYQVFGIDQDWSPVTPYSGIIGLTDFPTISLSLPNGNSYTAPASITINASPSDSNNGAVVSLYEGNTPQANTLLQTITVAPYSYTWPNVPAGGYFLKATVTYNNGWTVTSGSGHVSVQAPPPPLIAPTIGDGGPSGSYPGSFMLITNTNPGTVTLYNFYCNSSESPGGSYILKQSSSTNSFDLSAVHSGGWQDNDFWYEGSVVIGEVESPLSTPAQSIYYP
jgi:hypothetical protein